MASNTVPLCIKDEAFLSMVTDELNGLFFETKEQYEEKVLTLYNDKELHKRLNNQARIQAEHYSSRSYASNVLEVYKRAIAEKKIENRFGIFSKIAKKLRGE